MSSTALDRIGRSDPVSRPDRVGQATAVEQSRAVAEVQAAIIVAQQVPRDIQASMAQMRDSCQQTALAERAFFRYRRAGSQITGPSVHLARELARCWGNVQYGIGELHRDDMLGQSEMQAWAWDVQTNTRSSSVFIVPHRRDVSDGTRTLTAMRDIYENNANAGARRVRETIFAVLPPWFTEEAKDICNRTLAEGGGKSLAQRIDEAVTAYEGMGIERRRLEDRVGKPVGRWDGHDVAQLGVVFTSLQRGEVTREEEFPTERVTGAEITGQQAQQPAQPEQPEQPDVGRESPLLNTSGQLARHMFGLFGQVGITDKAERLAYVSDVVGREVTTSRDLTDADAERVVESLNHMRDRMRADDENPNPEGGES